MATKANTAKNKNSGVNTPQKGRPKDPVEALQYDRRQLQQKAVDAQTQEMELYRQQMVEQDKIEQQNVQLLQSQVDDARTTASAYMQQLSLLQQAQEAQNLLAAQEAERTGLISSQQNSMMANRANLQRRMNSRRQTANARTSGVGIFR